MKKLTLQELLAQRGQRLQDVLDAVAVGELNGVITSQTALIETDSLLIEALQAVAPPVAAANAVEALSNTIHKLQGMQAKK